MTSRCACTLFVAVLMLLPATPARGDAISLSSIGFGNLLITPQAGALEFAGPWDAIAFAQAANSFGEFDQEFDFSSGGTAAADASVTFASAAAIGSALTLTGRADSLADIPGCEPRAASAVGQAGLLNSFSLVGVTEPTVVDFDVDLSGTQRLRTDACGRLAESEIIFRLLLDGLTVLFHQSRIEIGPADALDLLLAIHLHGSVLLNPGQSYGLFTGVDAESRAITAPEPPGIALLVLGVIAGLFYRRRRTEACRLQAVRSGEALPAET